MPRNLFKVAKKHVNLDKINENMQPRRTYIKCTDVAQHVLDHLDVKLDSLSFREIKKHLDQCPNCDAYLDSVKKTITLYRMIPLPHAPHNLRKKLISVVRL